MKSYNAENRLRKAILVVCISIKWKNVGKEHTARRLLLKQSHPNSNPTLSTEPLDFQKSTSSIEAKFDTISKISDGEIMKSISGLNIKSKNKSNDKLSGMKKSSSVIVPGVSVDVKSPRVPVKALVGSLKPSVGPVKAISLKPTKK